MFQPVAKFLGCQLGGTMADTVSDVLTVNENFLTFLVKTVDHNMGVGVIRVVVVNGLPVQLASKV